MTKMFKDLVREEFQKYYAEEGLFASPDINKLVEEILKIIGDKVEKYQLSTSLESLGASIKLLKPLSPTENSKVKKLIKEFGYANVAELFDKTQILIERRYPLQTPSS